MSKTLKELSDIVDLIEYPGFKFDILEHVAGGFYLQVRCQEGVCNVTGRPYEWKGRKWPLSTHMTVSEVVGTAFLAVRTAQEHEDREKFTYRGEAVYDTHVDVEALWTLRYNDVLDERPPAPAVPPPRGVVTDPTEEMTRQFNEALDMLDAASQPEWRTHNGATYLVIPDNYPGNIVDAFFAASR